mmetsp:Transcript_12354/g.16189  ORF Transcript_12354/g.16189 Transcript_12354/m.16189 type:complete len:100 (+) Transcript_12354:13-312(+)
MDSLLVRIIQGENDGALLDDLDTCGHEQGFAAVVAEGADADERLVEVKNDVPLSCFFRSMVQWRLMVCADLMRLPSGSSTLIGLVLTLTFLCLTERGRT